MTEPVFVAQTFDPEHMASGVSRATWFRDQAHAFVERRGKKVGWGRFTIGPDREAPEGLLIELWDDRPTDEGPARWSLEEAK